MFSYVSPEERVPAEHPLRPIREMADVALKALSLVFDRMYAAFGRPSIAPEKLLRALLLQVLYTVRSERMLMEQLQYNLLFRWFVGMNMDEPVWVPTVFSKNRDRLMEGDIAERFFALILDQASAAGLLSDEHFSVDGTLIEAWASQKKFSAEGHTRSGAPGRSRQSDSQLSRGKPAATIHMNRRQDPDATDWRARAVGMNPKLAYCGNAMIENRNGLVVDTELVQCSGTAERDAALLMAGCIPGTGRVTVAGDKGYDTREFVSLLRDMKVTPHVAQNEKRPGGSAIDGRTTHHSGCQVSQKKRKRIVKKSALAEDRKGCCARPDTADSTKCAGFSRSQPPRIIWCACGI